jgi:hypothetical protein
MIDPNDAASALAAVDRTQRRAFELRGYAHAGDILIGWGLVWLVCNLTTYAVPGIRWVWPVGVLVCTIWSAARGSAVGPAGARRPNLRVFATVATIVGLVMLVSKIAGIHNFGQGNALASIFVAAAYVVQGIWTGRRFAWIGLVLAAMVYIGWFMDRGHLELWLGIGGGGAFVLTGLWLRRA